MRLSWSKSGNTVVTVQLPKYNYHLILIGTQRNRVSLPSENIVVQCNVKFNNSDHIDTKIQCFSK